MSDTKKIAGADNAGKAAYLITITGCTDTVRVKCSHNESLLDAMIRQNILVSAACGGRGTCGKCRIQLLKGKLAITQADRAIFSEAELKEGLRLSCKAYPSSDCIVKLIHGEEKDFEVISDYLPDLTRSQNGENDYAIAVDIGTTTIAASLIRLSDGNVLGTYTAVNRQRVYGADVISRIQAANDGKMEELRKSIQNDLLAGIRTVTAVAGIPKDRVRKIAIAGNTTMGHLLLGYSCRTLGVYPFTPVNIETVTLKFEEIFETDEMQVPVTLLPGISAFVGADIASGLLACGFDKAEAPCMLIDLGTNGEMAVGNKDRVIVSSTAAGPAFEGGNISCGTGSIAGAICNIDIEEGKLHYRTIGDKAPVGICGTGVIELVSELVKSGLADSTGLLCEEYFDQGYRITPDESGSSITFTQKDIREIQLAKAAIRAGIEILIRRYGIRYEDLDTLYLAGGFGYQINIKKAAAIGLIPQELAGRVKTAGNSSLGGALQYLVEESADERLKHIIHVAREINLSNDKDFNDLYVKYMYFDK